MPPTDQPPPIDELARARAAARAYCKLHGFAVAPGMLDGPPVVGPTTFTRRTVRNPTPGTFGHGRREVTAFRWLGAGRGQDFVQVEVDTHSGAIMVFGARGHDALPPWRADDHRDN